MNGCVVCIDTEPGYCEFCPTPPRAITDRDPGDEMPDDELQRAIDAGEDEGEYVGDHTEDISYKLSRSWRATYRTDIAPGFPWGGRLIYRDFIGPDSYLDAVAIAEARLDPGERLLNVSELNGGNVRRP